MPARMAARPLNRCLFMMALESRHQNSTSHCWATVVATPATAESDVACSPDLGETLVGDCVLELACHLHALLAIGSSTHVGSGPLLQHTFCLECRHLVMSWTQVASFMSTWRSCIHCTVVHLLLKTGHVGPTMLFLLPEVQSRQHDLPRIPTLCEPPQKRLSFRVLFSERPLLKTLRTPPTCCNLATFLALPEGANRAVCCAGPSHATSGHNAANAVSRLRTDAVPSSARALCAAEILLGATSPKMERDPQDAHATQCQLPATDVNAVL